MKSTDKKSSVFFPTQAIISRLSSGGIIATYKCHAACGHCLYGCSQRAEPGYIDESTAEKVCRHLRRLKCYSVHIGGGEPFLNPKGLVKLIKIIIESGLRIDYIETNAAWITDDDRQNTQILSDVVRVGGDCVMVSADPFHVEYIPFWKPERLIRLLRQNGIQHFIWQERYLPLLQKLNPMKTYTGGELQDIFAYDVIGQCVREYGMGYNGRALNLLRKYGKKKPIEYREEPPPCVPDTLPESCPELYNTSHFHADYLGRYIPPGCTGMGILLEDVGYELDPDKYPVISRLFEGGVRKLFEYAISLGYKPEPDGYYSKCELCFNIRKYLMNCNQQTHSDLTPKSFYEQDF